MPAKQKTVVTLRSCVEKTPQHYVCKSFLGENQGALIYRPRKRLTLVTSIRGTSDV